MAEPEWTRVRPSLNQRSVIDYKITDTQLMKESGVVQVDIVWILGHQITF